MELIFLIFTKETPSDSFIRWKVRAAQKVIGNSHLILRDQRQRPSTSRIRVGSLFQKETAEPLFHFACHRVITVMLRRIGVSGSIPVVCSAQVIAKNSHISY